MPLAQNDVTLNAVTIYVVIYELYSESVPYYSHSGRTNTDAVAQRLDMKKNLFAIMTCTVVINELFAVFYHFN